jgi:hypothetical protein
MPRVLRHQVELVHVGLEFLVDGPDARVDHGDEDEDEEDRRQRQTRRRVGRDAR